LADFEFAGFEADTARDLADVLTVGVSGIIDVDVLVDLILCGAELADEGVVGIRNGPRISDSKLS
jgi:hypothetical protein